MAARPLNCWPFPQMLRRCGTSARSARALNPRSDPGSICGHPRCVGGPTPRHQRRLVTTSAAETDTEPDDLHSNETTRPRASARSESAL